jgi:hypothetical protein
MLRRDASIPVVRGLWHQFGTNTSAAASTVECRTRSAATAFGFHPLERFEAAMPDGVTLSVVRHGRAI